MSYIPAALTAKNQLAPNTCEFKFSVQNGESYQFKPGQYTWVILPDLAENEGGDRRAFSITSCCHDQQSVSIIARSSDSTYKQTLFALEHGAQIQLTPATGTSFVIEENNTHPLCFVAGGVGVTPFLSRLRSQTTPPNYAQTLIFINRSAESAFLLDEIRELCQRTQTALVEHTGDVFPDLFSSVLGSEHVEFYISGSQRFVNASSEALRSLNISPEAMHFEHFYPHSDQTRTDFFSESLRKDDASQNNPFRLLVEHNSLHLVVTDADGKIIYANTAAQQVTGYTFSEMRSQTPRLWGSMMSGEFYSNLWKQIKIDKVPFVGEITNRRKNGETYVSFARITPIIQENSVIGFIASEEDITQRVEMERQIAYEKVRSEAMLASIGEGLVALDKDGRVMLVNQSASTMLNISKDEIVGKLFSECIGAEDENGNAIDQSSNLFSKALQSQQPVNQMVWYRRSDGTKFAAEVVLSPIVLDDQIIGAIQVFRDVTEELKIDTMKSEFISLASHQLRTPLSSIRWYLEMLLDGDVGEITEEQRKFAQEAYQGAQRMASLVNSLLNVARIESGSYMISPVPTDLIQLIRSVLDELKVQTDQKNIHLQFEKEDIPEMSLDPELFRIVIYNLLTNAIKYSQRDSTVSVRLQQVTQNDPLLSDHSLSFESGILIQVIDAGIGIPQDEQERIFSKLYRATNVTKTEAEGTGLGLYIARNIIIDAKGKIWFSSKEGEGTTFSILLPSTGMAGKDGMKKLS